ncbi:MAG: hypothetical protein OXU45_01450 [Candidatus Melainabacteria bacterium]|nr:hypothetical protein [Candidatus Melainabacteria bacterium]
MLPNGSFEASLRSSLSNFIPDANGMPIVWRLPQYKPVNIKAGMVKFFDWLDERVSRLAKHRPIEENGQDQNIIDTELDEDDQDAIRCLKPEEGDSRILLENLARLSPLSQQANSTGSDIVRKCLGARIKTDSIPIANRNWSNEEIRLVPYLLANLLIAATKSNDNFVRNYALDGVMRHQQEQIITETLLHILQRNHELDTRAAIIDLLSRPAPESVGTLIYNQINFDLDDRKDLAAALNEAAIKMAKRIPDAFLEAINKFAASDFVYAELIIKQCFNTLVESGKAGRAKLIEFAHRTQSNKLANMAIEATEILEPNQAYDFLISIIEAPSEDETRDLKHMAMSSMINIVADQDQAEPDFFRLLRILNGADRLTRNCVQAYVKSHVQDKDFAEIRLAIAGKSNKLDSNQVISALAALDNNAIPLIIQALIENGLEAQANPCLELLEHLIDFKCSAQSLNELKLQIAHHLIHNDNQELLEQFQEILDFSKELKHKSGSLIDDYVSKLLLDNMSTAPQLQQFFPTLWENKSYAHHESLALETAIQRAAD